MSEQDRTINEPDPSSSSDVTRDEEFSMRPGGLFQNKYKIINIIGEGGYGRVYRVRDRLIGKDFALKVIKRELAATTVVRERFLREIRVMLDLMEEHIIPIREFGETGEGNLYLTMDFVEGRDLSKMMKKHPRGLPMDSAVDILAQILQGLSIAHGKKIIHRDLKPANLLVEKTSEGVTIKIADFGLAHLLRENTDSIALTSNATLGTPLYMSPEQATGDTVTLRSDLYAVGIIAYQLVSGRLPFQGKTSREVLAKQIHKQPEKLSRLQQAPDVPSWLEQIIEKAMEKDPEKRFATAKDFLHALEARDASRYGGKGIAYRRGSGKKKKLPLLVKAGLPTTLAALGFIFWDYEGNYPVLGEDKQVKEIRATVFPSLWKLMVNGEEPEKIATVGKKPVKLEAEVKSGGPGCEPLEDVEILISNSNSGSMVRFPVFVTDCRIAIEDLCLEDGENLVELIYKGDGSPKKITMYKVPSITLDGEVELEPLGTDVQTFISNEEVLKLKVCYPGNPRVLDTVEVYIDNENSRVKPVASGNEYEFEIPLDEGNHRIAFYSLVQNESILLKKCKVIVDRSAPEIRIDTPLPEVTNADTIEIEGLVLDDNIVNAEPKEVVHIRLDPPSSVEVNGQPLSDNGKFAAYCKLPEGEDYEGEVKVYAAAKDKAGNCSDTEKPLATIRVDRKSPEIDGDLVFDYEDKNLLFVNGKMNEELDEDNCGCSTGWFEEVKGSEFRYSYDGSGIEKGVKLTLRDVAGNKRDITFKVDPTRPKLTDLAFKKNSKFTRKTEVVLIADDNLSEIECYGTKFSEKMWLSKEIDNNMYEYRFCIDTSLALLTDPDWAPTSNPIRIVLKNEGGLINLTDLAFVICPECKKGITKKQKGSKEVYYCEKCDGWYCPKDNKKDRHRISKNKKDRIDVWISKNEAFCTYCQSSLN